ncbi:hypothetical protein H6F75_12360 [Nodosilinea sp. FACHB-131]|uniref:GxxExxY protein n=1 Tax=Cyanophyceae TaxID=3028117 RepID=UPI001685B813|nr:GxxExxY protein [Nodosilinea sp. FACHB-131]MBD1874279.1 hypothetical protein [Nodosilinea sp. FACHB-131]
MDLLKILRSKIDILEEGEHIPGLSAVLLHIETASRHLLRGQENDDSTAFTDAIYRTNQAFEGSLKEAYRVFAEKSPDRKNTFEIESYFERNNIFRQRVLTQFTNYRTEWRNPSIHDYKLDFDESEAFLAIVSVTAFACLMLDQICERVAYSQTKIESQPKKKEIRSQVDNFVSGDFFQRIIEIFKEFSRQQLSFNPEEIKLSESYVAGQIMGFFASVFPEIEIEYDYKIGDIRVDFRISDGSSQILVEIKRFNKYSVIDVSQLAKYQSLTNIKLGILFQFSDTGGELRAEEMSDPLLNSKIFVLTPLPPQPIAD